MQKTVQSQQTDYSPKRISYLATQLSKNLTGAIDDIKSINEMTKILSINAKITSARVGVLGRGFGVVADEMMQLAERTKQVAESLHYETRDSIDELNGISQLLDTHVRGQRLSIFAQTNIDLIDRNLYERSCDVRWWATDMSLVDALSEPHEKAFQHASERLGVILSAYTVYFDLVLADSQGRIVANGRPDLFSTQGKIVLNEPWFQMAVSGTSGDEYGLQTVHDSSLVNNQHSLIYSCGIREGGKSDGKILGALGIIFDWDGLAKTIVENTPIDHDEWVITRACITDSSGAILADTMDKQLIDSLKLNDERVFIQESGFLEMTISGKPFCVAYSGSMGFETYNSGWHSFILQEL